MKSSNVSDVVRSCYAAFFSRDRAGMEELLSDDFTFTSPQDDHIDKDEYFVRCWPNSDKLRDFKLEKLFEKGDEAFVRYQVTRVEDGVKFRNAEYLKCAGNRIVEIQVYFGAEEKK
jgi:ketosteroid isomerase-like protein